MFEKPIDVLWHLLDPIQFLCLSASYLPITIFHLIATLQFSALFSPAAFKDAWFARFWIWAGPGNRENSIPRVRPLISQARGVVLEIGPGSGEWVDLYDQEKVTRIYGVEPNKDHHELLRKRIKDSGLSDIYVIVPVGIEELGEKWVAQEDVDTVVTIQCLCSIPRPQEMIDAISKYLKEGGQWIIYEHVVTKQGGFIGAYQGEWCSSMSVALLI
jgi:SAM-dependent methyltransferase